ncbi:MAG TPA: restriction endonuclease subunit S [Thermodesulfobacteriota bacterium]|nr:restriction endonuclease subunit S [Thermodesulfobacteriota bacterium]
MAGIEFIPFEKTFAVPLRNGLTRPKAVRGMGTKMVNMGELFAYSRIRNIEMERVPLTEHEASSFLLEPGDLLFARQSLVLQGAGKCAVFLGDDEPVTFESHIIRARLNAAIADPVFFYYFFSSLIGRSAIESIVEQVAASGIRSSDLAKLEVPQIPLSEQRAIAHILGTLDDKIELNRRMNETLEAMAKAIFKSWFVDFDPVRAKSEGRDPGLSKHIADLFPDRFQDSELGEIPEGWEVKFLGELLELAYGKALKEANRRSGSVPVFGSNGQVGWHNEKLAPGPGIIVGRKGNPGMVTWSPTDFFAIDTTFYVVPRGKCRSLYFLYHALRSQDLASLGADSAVPGLNRKLVYMSQAVTPKTPPLDAFDKMVRPIFEQIYHNDEESRTLTALRDTLLPKLISGELRVGNSKQLRGHCDEAKECEDPQFPRDY